MFKRAMILMRDVNASFSLIGGFMTVFRMPSTRNRIAKLFFVRLDVNVARAVSQRVHENEVHKADDGRFFRLNFQSLGIEFTIVFAEDLKIVALVFLLARQDIEYFFEREVFMTSEMPVDAVAYLLFRGEERLDF